MLEESHNKEQIQANFIVAFLQRQFEDRYGAKLHPKNKGFMTDTLKILRVRNAGYFDQTVRQDSRPLPLLIFGWFGTKKNVLVQNDPKNT